MHAVVVERALGKSLWMSQKMKIPQNFRIAASTLCVAVAVVVAAVVDVLVYGV